MYSTPHISIVMPVYNSEKLIKSTVQSVINQTFEDWELIIVDDHSTDATCDIVNELIAQESRIRLLKLSRNYGGPARPRNKGVKAAQGIWVSFLDSDDIWHPKKLEMQLEVTENLKANFSSTKMKDFTFEEEIVFDNIENLSVNYISFYNLRVKDRVPTSSVMAHKTLLMEFPFNEDPKYKAVEDYDCWLHIHKKISESPKLNFPFLNYRRVEGQISGSKMYMLKGVFMVHRAFPASTFLSSVLFTATHVILGIYYRLILKEL